MRGIATRPVPEWIFRIGIAAERENAFAVIVRRVKRFKAVQDFARIHIRQRHDARPAAVRRVEPDMRRAAENGENQECRDGGDDGLAKGAFYGAFQAIPPRIERDSDRRGDHNQEVHHEMEHSVQENRRDEPHVRYRIEVSTDKRQRHSLVHPAHDFVVAPAKEQVYAHEHNRHDFQDAQSATFQDKRNRLQTKCRRHDEADIGKHRVPQETVPVRNEGASRRGITEIEHAEETHTASNHNQREEEPVKTRHGHLWGEGINLFLLMVYSQA